MAHPLAFLSPHFHRIVRLFLVSILLLGMLAVAPAQAAPANTWTVCPSGCDYTTIATAVGSATSGDTILLNVAGVHTEPAYVYIDRGVTIEGLGMYTTTWQAADTPGFSNHRLLETSYSEIPLVTIRNMTLRNGGSGSTGEMDRSSSTPPPPWKTCTSTITMPKK